MEEEEQQWTQWQTLRLEKGLSGKTDLDNGLSNGFGAPGDDGHLALEAVEV